jgi:hypothetical protein
MFLSGTHDQGHADRAAYPARDDARQVGRRRRTKRGRTLFQMPTLWRLFDARDYGAVLDHQDTLPHPAQDRVQLAWQRVPMPHRTVLAYFEPNGLI